MITAVANMTEQKVKIKIKKQLWDLQGKTASELLQCKKINK